MRPPICRRQEGGFALLIVLLTVMLLSLFATRLTGQARVEVQLAQNLRSAAQAEAAADAAIHTAIFHLLDSPERRWAADGALRTLETVGSPAVVRIVSLGGKVNPNTVSPALFQALLQEIGVDERTAMAISAAVADWRVPTTVPRPFGAKLPQYRAAGRDYGPPGEPFQSLDELGLVLGMTPPLMQQLRPYMSLFTATEPDPRLADPVVIGRWAARGDRRKSGRRGRQCA